MDTTLFYSNKSKNMNLMVVGVVSRESLFHCRYAKMSNITHIRISPCFHNILSCICSGDTTVLPYYDLTCNYHQLDKFFHINRNHSDK